MTDRLTSPSTDMTIAKHLFDRIDRMGISDLNGLKLWKKTSASFHGDITLCAIRPSGGIHFLLGDCITDGLPRAMTALPVAEVFYGMTEKGFSLSAIIEEINKKLLFVLPEGLHCSVCMMELDQVSKLLTVWNGGMPDVLVVDKHANISHRISSTKQPLGLKASQTSALDLVFVEVSAGDTVFWCSDGAINAENTQGTMIGQAQIARLLSQDARLSAISTAINRYVVEDALIDDITLAQLDIAILQQSDFSSRLSSTATTMSPAKWQVDLSLSAAVLRNVDLTPLLVNLVMQIQAPHEQQQRISTVLAEMCNNALDHGVLGLPSSMKASANGFAEYYTLRAQRLTEVEDAYINIVLRHEPVKMGGCLTISIEDSGVGFDYDLSHQDLAENTGYSGRGEKLIRKLCSEYFHSGNGNIAHAVYVWSMTS